jgi:uncharacterized protein (TIGR03067 family)
MPVIIRFCKDALAIVAVTLVFIGHSNSISGGSDKLREQLTGKWKVDRLWMNGVPQPQEAADQEFIEFTKDKIVMSLVRDNQKTDLTFEYKLNDKATPHEIDIVLSSTKVLPGVFKFENEWLYLTINTGKGGQWRPEGFTPRDSKREKIYKMTRQK